MGDCNKWWCIHAGASDHEIHQMGPRILPRVPEEFGATEVGPFDVNSANFVKAIITKARDDRQRDPELQGSRAGAAILY